MKITISESESYEIKTEDTLTKDQFLGLMDRLDHIRRIVSKDMISNKMISDSIEKTTTDNTKTTSQTTSDNKNNNKQHPNNRKGTTTAGDFDTKEKASKLMNDFYILDKLYLIPKERRIQKKKFSETFRSQKNWN